MTATVRRPKLRPGDPLRALPGVGPVRARQLAEAGYETIGELLTHLPFRYEDRTTVRPIAELLDAWRAGTPVLRATVRGRLEGVRRLRVRRRGLSIVRGRVRDATGALAVTWFNRPYLANQANVEAEYLLHGELRPTRGRAGIDGSDRVGPELLNPSCEAADSALHSGRVVPVYPAAGELGPAAVRRLLAVALEALEPATIPEPLPDEVRARHHLPRLGDALRALHAPAPEADVAALEARRTPAHGRLAYGETLEVQLALARLRAERAIAPKTHRYAHSGRLPALATELLPFRLTPGQEGALREVADDLARPTPMLRLLQGEVGSGKTAVAALALAHAAASGLQGALMVPTELLAEQHYRNLTALLGRRARVVLVSGSDPGLPAAREALARGEADLAVGTHALIQDGVELPRLGLVVIDEQHRFGVLQRRSLEGKADRPDVLVMTATPIPRSLALTQYGELDLSILDGLPPGRSPVATEVVDRGERRRVYRRLAGALDAGERAYVVFPRIGRGDGDATDAAGAAPCLEVEGEEVREWLGRGRTAVLHGGTDPGSRRRILAELADGRVSALLATTVVEVGVDVPEATWMVIEGADRFGLAQLHQLRGRVGRGARPSRCTALAAARTDEARRRLEVFAGCSDGFRIAEEDLRLRGFGELLGTRQAGVLGFRVAHPVADREWLEHARRDAPELVPRLAEPGFARLRRRVERRLAARRKALEGGSP